jgi:hypothetical protein
MFLHQTLPHLLASVAFQNVMPTQKSRGTLSERIHQMVKMSGQVPMKSIIKSSFKVSSQLLLGCSMIGPVVNLPLAAPPNGDGSRISSSKCIMEWSLTMAVKALRLLQPAKGANNSEGKGSCFTAKQKKEQRWNLVPALLWFLLKSQCLNKTAKTNQIVIVKWKAGIILCCQDQILWTSFWKLLPVCSLELSLTIASGIVRGFWGLYSILHTK